MNREAVRLLREPFFAFSSLRCLTFTQMSCTPVTAAMRRLLVALAVWPEVDTKDLRHQPEWEQAREWGWVMESGELTGSGLAHVGQLPGGLVTD